MKIDLYSKFLFTVIAICLVVIVLRDVSFVSELKATPAGLTMYSDIKANSDGSIDVRIIDSKELKVEIDPYSTVNTCIKKVDLPFNEGIDVNIVGSEKKLNVAIDPNSIVNTCIKKIETSPYSTSLPVKVTNVSEFPSSNFSQIFQEVDPVEVYSAQTGVRIVSPWSVPVSVYKLDGSEVIRTRVEGETILPLESGCYVVKAGEQVTKIAVG